MVAREKAFRIVVCAALMFGAAAMTACDDGGDPNFWGKTYDYTDAGQEILAMAPVSGGYVVAGTVSVYAGGMSDMGDLWIAKLDSEGQVEWQNIIHGAKMEIGIDNMSVIQTADGGYAVTCRSNSFTDDFAPLVANTATFHAGVEVELWSNPADCTVPAQAANINALKARGVIVDIDCE